MLFSNRSILAMLHGLVLGGGAVVLLILAVFWLRAGLAHDGNAVSDRYATIAAWLTIGASAVLWLSVFTGTFIVFPMYRATPPEGVTALTDYPRALLMSNADTRWLHAIGMEIKEHMPWIAGMLATAAAFTARQHRTRLHDDAQLRRMTVAVLAIALVLVAFTALLGVFVNKVAPLW
jgi:uncharacterized protein involved in response to NO